MKKTVFSPNFRFFSTSTSPKRSVGPFFGGQKWDLKRDHYTNPCRGVPPPGPLFTALLGPQLCRFANYIKQTISCPHFGASSAVIRRREDFEIMKLLQIRASTFRLVECKVVALPQGHRNFSEAPFDCNSCAF